LKLCKISENFVLNDFIFIVSLLLNLSENAKQNQFICKYTTSTDEMMTDNLNFKLKNPLAIQMIFSTKSALADFLNLFDH